MQRDLAVSSTKIGNVLREQGDLEAALAAYRESLATTLALAANDPANTDWQRDLSVSLEKVADVLHKQGDLEGALDGYERSLPIMQRLAASDATNADWQRDLSITLAEIGNLRLQQRDFNGAGTSLRRQPADPGDAGIVATRQRALAARPGDCLYRLRHASPTIRRTC